MLIATDRWLVLSGDEMQKYEVWSASDHTNIRALLTGWHQRSYNDPI